MAELNPIVLDEPTQHKLWSLYRSAFPRLEDGVRNQETFRWLCLSDKSQIFEGPDGIIIFLTEVIPGHPIATISFINEGTWSDEKRDAVYLAIVELLDMFSLNRLAAYHPGPVKEVGEILESLGFMHEGTLRQHLKFNGEFVDMQCYSLLRSDIELAKEPEVEPRKPTLVERTFEKHA